MYILSVYYFDKIRKKNKYQIFKATNRAFLIKFYQVFVNDFTEYDVISTEVFYSVEGNLIKICNDFLNINTLV